MSGLFKCLLVSCVFPAIFGLTSVRDDVSWFKNGQGLKNRFVTGVVNGIVDFDCSDTANGAEVEGECMSKIECTKSGGKIGGLCSLLGSCCVLEKTCSESTSSKLSYFVPPKQFQTDCPLTVNVYSKSVCQIRLDFEKFDLAKPTNNEIKINEDESGYTSYQCHDDAFQVDNTGKNLGFPHLCGRNKGQHIYVPISENTQRIVLRFSLKNRTTGVNLPPPDWRIKIRQLECRRSGYDHLNAPTKLMAMYNTLKNKKNPKSDYDLIAPPNCLQYYPAKSGVFESFNYDEGRGCYIGHLNYAICFRKTPDICGARYADEGRFQMNYNKIDDSDNQIEDKCHPKKQASFKISQDYIRIPGGVNSGNNFRDHYCNTDFFNTTVIANSYEPLYIGVHTDGYRPNKAKEDDEEVDDAEEIGFRIRYDLHSGNLSSPLILNLASQYDLGDAPLEGAPDDPRVPVLDGSDEDRFSFEDSDRFEDDSLCSWSTEPEPTCNNWRGWKRPGTQGGVFSLSSKRSTEVSDPEQTIPSLTELTAKCVASHIPFELVEHVYPPVPEQLQLRIAFWSFPDNEEDIRLYSCLANGSSDEFQRGDNLYRSRAVQDPLQIGFHLSATVLPANFVSGNREQHNVAVTFDRRRITSCNCTCSSAAYWCSHVVAVCLYRINNPEKVCLRAPVSESLSRLKREQLQKFAQYLISELPQQILPTAQRLLDELLSSQPSAINSVCGAPDPTAGASVSDQTSWYLDQKTLHNNIKKILIKFCVPSPMVFSDVNCLSTTAPPAAAEWTSLLRPLRGREPEGMWNLLSIVMEMFKRNDRNAVPLLEIITEECMACDQILVWWYTTSAALHSGNGGGKHSGANSSAHASQHACSSLCDEIVVLWRLAALNPGISPEERLLLEKKFTGWHSKIIDKVSKSRGNVMTTNNTINVFPGFKPAIQACRLDWEDYPLPGITYTVGSNQIYHCPFTCFRHNEGNVNQVNSSHAVLNCHFHTHYHSYPYGKHKKMLEFFPRRHNQKSTSIRNGYRSSVSSEGFCENEGDPDMPSHSRAITTEQDDVDSQEGGGSDSGSSSDAGACQVAHSSEMRNVMAETSKKVRSFAVKEQSQSSEDSDLGVFIGNEASHYGTRSKKTEEERDESKLKNKSLHSNTSGRNPDMSVLDVNSDFTCDIVIGKSGEFESEGDSPRRASNDSATSNSDSQQSGDEYNVYYYTKPPKQPEPVQISDEGQEKEDFERNKVNEDPWDILFARSEGLHAHGHAKEACTLAVRLALELLANPPNLMVEIPHVHTKGKRKRINPASHQISCLASATLSKCAFLCSVLGEVPDYHHLAFRIGMFGLEMARPPATTKPLEVKLANQESELLNLMKRIPLGPEELNIVREKAEQLRDGTLRSRGEALLPIMLASFVFDALEGNSSSKENKSEPKNSEDESLAFEAAVAALGLKANVSEADHPLLCEGTRRQRGDLVLTLLMHYKDDPAKLARIMEKLLDREVHNLIKTPLCVWYYSTSTHPKIHSKRMGTTSTEGEEELDSLGSAFLPSYDPVSQDLPNPWSRPHSSTSAELEQSFISLSLVNCAPRTKEMPRYKGKRLYPSIPNQPSEAGAHFMFELAKTVLNKAGGNSSTSLFIQASTSQQHHGPHRGLHFCAFQIGLYALGLHNRVSPNWLSRTYSSHVSWITGQAMEIGVLAISFLIDTWEGHLSPTEAASIADRASRALDPNMIRAAAELALSCLPHSHALNPNEIQRAIVQCKEQGEVMLERSCITVEKAAKGGGVYPEVLFQVAKYWFDLYLRHTPGGEQPLEVEVSHDPMSLHFSLDPSGSGSVMAMVDSQEIQQHPAVAPQIQPPNMNSNMSLLPQAPPQGSVVMTSAPPPMLPVPYAVTPYSFAVHPLHPLPPPSHPCLYLTPPQYQYPNTPPGPMPQQYFVQGNSQPPLRPIAYPITTMQQVVSNQSQMQVVQPQSVAVTSTVNVGLQQPGPPVPPPHTQPTVVPGRPLPQPQVHRQNQSQHTSAQFRCLFSAYRVGMLALETLARRVHDDRPQAKYARNPPYGDDVKWLLQVSKKLGTQYLHQFCIYVVNSIVSPFILHEVAIESAHYLARNNPSLILQHLRSSLTPLVQKCQQMYIQCMHQKLYHLTASDYEDFVSVVCAARAAFHITPEGSQQFKEWLQSIKRSKSCKKELWQQINSALQANNK